MTDPATLAAFAEDRARQLACRAEYYAHPLISGTRDEHQCACGAKTYAKSGVCRACSEEYRP